MKLFRKHRPSGYITLQNIDGEDWNRKEIRGTEGKYLVSEHNNAWRKCEKAIEGNRNDGANG